MPVERQQQQEDHDKIIRLQAKTEHHSEVLDQIHSKVDKLLSKSDERDERMTRVETTVNSMAPSVETLKNGLIFWRVARWAVALIAGSGAYFYGVTDLLKGLFGVVASKKP